MLKALASNSITEMGATTTFTTDGENRARGIASIFLRRLCFWLLGLLIVSLPWRQRILLVERPLSPVYRDFTDLLLYIPDLLLLVLLILWGMAQWLRPQRLHPGPTWLWLPLIGLSATGVLSVINAVQPALSAFHALQLLLLLLFYLYLVNEKITLEQLAWPISIQVGLQTFIGVFQVWRQQDLGLKWLGERSLDPIAGSATVWAQGGLQSLRAYGLSDHPNILAINLVCSLLVLAVWIGGQPGGTPMRPQRRMSAISLPSQRAARVWRRSLTALLFGGALVAMLLTFSRTAWISLAGGGLTAVSLAKLSPWRRRLRNWMLLASLSLLILSPFVWRFLPYLSMGTTAEMMAARVQERWNSRMENQTLNNVTNRIFAANALNGVGMAGLPVAIERGTTDFPYDYQPSRFVLMTVAAETGLLAALIYLVLQLTPWAVLWFERRRLRATSSLLGFSAALMALFIFSLLDAYPWSYSSGRVWQYLLWGTWVVAYVEARRPAAGNLYA
jgi:hypothetical protein